MTKTWDEILNKEKEEMYFKNILEYIDEQYEKKVIYPSKENIFRCFKETPFDKVKVVIIGQDPYHNPNQAEGLAFSVKDGVKLPPSLVNIFKELKTDLNIDPPKSGSLIKWANEGVLLMNAIFTVEENKPASHQKIGWQIFSDKILRELSKDKSPKVFILWGNFARSKKVLIDDSIHLIIESNHPSPLSANRGFFGTKPFSKTNDFLIKNGISPVNWQID